MIHLKGPVEKQKQWLGIFRDTSARWYSGEFYSYNFCTQQVSQLSQFYTSQHYFENT